MLAVLLKGKGSKKGTLGHRNAAFQLQAANQVTANTLFDSFSPFFSYEIFAVFILIHMYLLMNQLC